MLLHSTDIIIIILIISLIIIPLYGTGRRPIQLLQNDALF